jgi:hypothetical protein
MEGDSPTSLIPISLTAAKSTTLVLILSGNATDSDSSKGVEFVRHE